MPKNNSSCAKDGGANSAKTTMPPVSQEYRDNYDSIFGKSKCNKEGKMENSNNPRFNQVVEYSVALQRAIEYHCENKIIPEEIVKLCPFHAEKLNNLLKNK